jgi:hypothetical protein
MANEATIRASLQVLKGNIDYRSQPQMETGDITGTAGPTPGLVVATASGVDIDFSAIVTPGYATLHNIDDVNFVEVGIWDGAVFHPLLEILPGQIYPLRFSRNLTEEFGTGTGTINADVNTVRVKSNNQLGTSVNLVVEAFET